MRPGRLARRADHGRRQRPVTRARSTAERAEYFDLAEQADDVARQAERKSAVLAWDHEVNDNVQLFGDFLRVEHRHLVAAERAAGRRRGGGGPTRSTRSTRTSTVAQPLRRLPAQYETDTTGWRGVFGVRGDITGTWKYEIAGDWNYATSDYRNPGLIDTNAYNAAVACEPDGTCYNPFARVQAPGVLESFGRRPSRVHQQPLRLRLQGVRRDVPAAGRRRPARGRCRTRRRAAEVTTTTATTEKAAGCRRRRPSRSTRSRSARATTPKCASRSLARLQRAGLLCPRHDARAAARRSTTRRTRPVRAESSRCVGSRSATRSPCAAATRSRSRPRRCMNCSDRSGQGFTSSLSLNRLRCERQPDRRAPTRPRSTAASPARTRNSIRRRRRTSRSASSGRREGAHAGPARSASTTGRSRKRTSSARPAVVDRAAVGRGAGPELAVRLVRPPRHVRRPAKCTSVPARRSPRRVKSPAPSVTRSG